MVISKMIVVLPEFGRFARPIYELANSPFESSVFRTACEQIAPFDEQNSTDDCWRFAVDLNFSLRVSVEAVTAGEPDSSGSHVHRRERVRCAMLSVCWWEQFSRTDHVT